MEEEGPVMKGEYIRYFVTEDRVNDPDNGIYDTFGIEYRTTEQTIQIHDISQSAENVRNMVMQFNRLRLALEHFYDVVEDILELS